MLPEEALMNGVKIIDQVMRNHGFNFIFCESGRGSGGNYAFGKYVKENRILELHFRNNLGLVAYQIDEFKLLHENYMKVLGVYGQNRYPGFSNEPLEAFKHLLYDLENFTQDFLSGSASDFKNLADTFLKKGNRLQGFKALPK